MGDEAPSGLGDATVADKKKMEGEIDYDEIDEDLGVAEKGPSKIWKSKKEVHKEKKMVRWDQKDSVDKVRSKQTLRHSRNVMALRRKRRWMESLEEDESKEGTAAAGSGKKTNHDNSTSTGASAGQNKKQEKGLRQKFTAARVEVGDEINVGGEDDYLSGNLNAQPKRRTRTSSSSGSGNKAESRMEFRKKKSEIGNAALQRFL